MSVMAEGHFMSGGYGLNRTARQIMELLWNAETPLSYEEYVSKPSFHDDDGRKYSLSFVYTGLSVRKRIFFLKVEIQDIKNSSSVLPASGAIV